MEHSPTTEVTDKYTKQLKINLTMTYCLYIYIQNSKIYKFTKNLEILTYAVFVRNPLLLFK